MLLYLPPDIIDYIFFHIAQDSMDLSRNFIQFEHMDNIKRTYDYNGTVLNGLPHGQGTMTTCVKYTNDNSLNPRRSIWLLCNLINILKTYTPIIK